MEHAQLIGHCVRALDTFNVESRAIEEHVNQYLKHQPDLNEDEQVFVVEVFSGCVRYSNILSVVIDGFYNRGGQTVLRSEHNLYRVFAYLALFRLDELGPAHYRRFVWAHDTAKMYKFLNFALSDKNLQTWIKDEWCKLYDSSFVQTTLLSPILRWLPEIQEIIQHLKDKLDSKLKPKKQKISTTETKPFKLTQPRPRSIPIPEPIPKLQRSRPVPQTVYKDPGEFNVMEKIKQSNRRKAEERLMEASKSQFACANPEKSQKTRTRMEEIEQQQDSLLDFERHKSNPVPTAILNENVPFKLNTAAILREERLYRQREAKELEKLERLEAGARDTIEFNAWQSRMRGMDDQQALAEVERRRLEGKLSLEEAILARHELANRNRKKVEDMKAEADALMQEYMQAQLQEEERVKARVKSVADTHENSREAKLKMQQFKAQIVQQVIEENKELMRQALEEAEREMSARMELIRQIRAMEATPVNRNKLVDLATPAGHGLLSEMSIAELRERVSLLRIQQTEAEEEKRDDILATKQAKDEQLMDALATISRHRTENTRAAATRLETRKKTHGSERTPVEDPRVSELQQRLEAKRAERQRMQQSSKLALSAKSALRTRQLNNDKKALEESRWRELEMTRERTAQLASLGGISGSQSASRITARVS